MSLSVLQLASRASAVFDRVRIVLGVSRIPGIRVVFSLSRTALRAFAVLDRLTSTASVKFRRALDPSNVALLLTELADALERVE